ncbi:uncharacterized protein [Dysidea avara]|uniref:uncharacterized protein n=1 Tax=Dysidea avara TaxID=196820 RepID=UPI00331FB90F
MGTTECPLVSSVVTEFPYLESSLWVQQEFKAIASMEGSAKDNMKDWSSWCSKLIELGKAESATRPFIKKLLESIRGSMDLAKPDDAHDAACLELLTRLLYPHGFD